jgi:hypothetical protein
VCPHSDELGGPKGGRTVDDDVPQEFYDLVDRFIDLANELTRDHATSRVSAIIMFAAARYNAHCLLSLDPDALDNREAAVSYFVGQYRSMLEDNIDWLARPRRDG